MSDNKAREKATLTITEKEEFKTPIRTDYKSATTLATSINSVFQEVFKDYNGCYVEPGNRSINENAVMLVLDFIPGYDNQHNAAYSAFQLVGTSKMGDNARRNGPIAAAVAQHNQVMSSKENYEITQDAVDILYELLIPIVAAQTKDNPKSFSAHGVYVEGPDKNGYREVIHEYIRCVDITKIISLILPDKDEDGSPLTYEILPARPVPTGINAGNAASMNYLYSITQYNKKGMENIVREYGYTAGAFTSRVITV